MILYASLKMDISYYTIWLAERLRNGFVDIEKDHKTIERYHLTNIEDIYMFTRNPSKIYRNRDLFAKYKPKLITFITLYDAFYEPKIKNKDVIMNTIKKCKHHFDNYFGYGPIFYTNNHDKKWHLQQFNFLCSRLASSVNGVYLDFEVNDRCQSSSKTNVHELTQDEKEEIIAEIKDIASKYNLTIHLKPTEEDLPENALDIGQNNLCPAACEYCKHMTNRYSIKAKYQMHDPYGSMLYGNPQKEQKIKDIYIDNYHKGNIIIQNSLIF